MERRFMEQLQIINVNSDSQTVFLRDLHEALQIKERFSVWADRIKALFGDELTSVGKPTEVQNNGGIQIRELEDYIISVDNAKHICLMCKTEKGKECRQYLIDLEKAWNTPEQIMARALRVAEQTISSLNVKVLEMKPKADFFDAVADSKTAISMNDVSKVLAIKGYGRNNLFEFLRNEGILDRNNVPYQRYVDCGWFRVIEQKYTKNGEQCVTTKTLVYQKGVDAIRKRISEKEKK